MLGVVGEAAPNDALELALFPLPLVLFPGAILPLQIFEFRYRIMMHRLLHTNLCFGVIYNNAISGTAEVSCVGEVIKHERLVDNRFFLVCKGQERFRVNDVWKKEKATFKNGVSTTVVVEEHDNYKNATDKVTATDVFYTDVEPTS
ncbi:hypothetical protein GYH30_006661 [Glycine max]|uniref:Lon N-terminal domain-containing protein n=1 Tax=Glycine max TaxID=3847 RepID=K7KDV3_SOYBN|nr:hypothetical protein JHK87_006728 [Glycine soja]KAG5071676.1 hypothetical protein JHK86_006887 [Glycine max]KAH1069152.1 hypothetical protein GYH30_006661 [Glycine max]